MLEYFCNKKVISYIWEETQINKDFLESTELIEKSIKKLKKL
jgi:hypothetical protein